MGFGLMTSRYVINIGDASAIQWGQFNYELTLNGMSSGQIALDGIPPSLFSEFTVEKEIYIYKNGVFKFRGKIIDQETMTGGGLVLSYQGIELDLADKKSPMVGSATTRAWTSTSDHTIIAALLADVTGWSVDVTNSSSITVSSFRVSATESVWNSVIRLIEQTGKDIWIDQENKIVYLYDEYTRPSSFSFIDGQNAKDISRTRARSQAGKVIVYGKGDGDFQAIGTYGSGLPEHVIIDKNIISVDEADARAEVEYDKINPQQLTYSFTPLVVIDDLQVGDSGDIQNNSAGISETVDITRLMFQVAANGTETAGIEVTNPELRIAKKNSAEDANKFTAEYGQSQTSMQGSGNTLTWSRGVNAKNGSSLKLPFYLPEDFVEDQAGNMNISSLTFDYDLDPFKSGVGVASEDLVAVGLSPGSTDSHKHDASDSGHDHGLPTMTSSSYTLANLEGGNSDVSTLSSLAWNTSVCSVSVDPGTYDFVYVYVSIKANFTNTSIDAYIRLDDLTSADEIFEKVTGIDTNVNSGYILEKTYVVPIFGSISSADNINLDILPSVGGSYTSFINVYSADETHSHSVSGYDANSDNAAVSDANKSPGLSGNSETHDHNISIGDDVSDAASVNSTSVNLYLEYWSGSAWVVKHSVLSTGATLGQDVDMTNGGVYPDVFGWWRCRVEPNSTSADYAQALVKVKHSIENE